MRVLGRERAFAAGIVGLGLVGAVAAVVESRSVPLSTLALLAAAAVLSEYFQVDSDDRAADPADEKTFSFSSGIHLAAVIIAGPWAAALVAGLGVVVADRLRGGRWLHVSFNASAFMLSTLVGGAAFQLAGGTPGVMDLPVDLLAIVVLACVYSLVNTLLVSVVMAFSSGAPPWPLVLEASRRDAATDAAESGLGVAFAIFILHEPWAILVLGPLAIAVYQAHARLALLRRETARALETFANVVDERDPYTYRHSLRVAEYVSELGERLKLPPAAVARLRWAGRLHDLGKVTVDAAVIQKPGALDDDERKALLRHPRLSARLLRQFRFASSEARAVEYHHERFDGTGYYGLASYQVPLASHFLIVADAFDAMTSDRTYRSGLSRERALAEIEAQAGRQFHPSVARAFVALLRGHDPTLALSAVELAELRRAAKVSRAGFLRRSPDLSDPLALLGISGVLAGVGLGHLVLAGCASGLAGASLLWRWWSRRKGKALLGRLRASADVEPGDKRLEAIAALMTDACGLRWAAVMSWEESDLNGRIDLEWNPLGHEFSESALVSWFIRDADSDSCLLVEAGSELGSNGVFAALPIRLEGKMAGFLVLAFGARLKRAAAEALAAIPPELLRGLLVGEHAGEASVPPRSLRIAS